MSVLVIAEHHQGKLADNVAQLVTAAGQLGGEVHLLLLGQGLMPQRMPALPRAALDLLLCCTYFCTKGSPP